MYDDGEYRKPTYSELLENSSCPLDGNKVLGETTKSRLSLDASSILRTLCIVIAIRAINFRTRGCWKKEGSGHLAASIRRSAVQQGFPFSSAARIVYWQSRRKTCCLYEEKCCLKYQVQRQCRTGFWILSRSVLVLAKTKRQRSWDCSRIKFDRQGKRFNIDWYMSR